MTTLEEELQDEKYNDMSVRQIRDSLNAKNIKVTRRRMVTAKDLMRELTVVDGVAILDALESKANKTEVKWALEYLKGEGIDVNDANTRAQLDLLLPAGLSSKVKALAEVQISRAEQLGLGKVKGRQVEVALNG